MLLKTKPLFIAIRSHNLLVEKKQREADLKGRLTALMSAPETTDITRLGLKSFIEREQKHHVPDSRNPKPTRATTPQP